MSRRVGRLMGSVIVLFGLLGVGVLSHPKTSRRPLSTPLKHILNDHGWRSWVLDTLFSRLSITVVWSHFKSFPVRIRRPRAVPLRSYPVSLPQCCNGAARPIFTTPSILRCHTVPPAPSLQWGPSNTPGARPKPHQPQCHQRQHQHQPAPA